MQLVIAVVRRRQRPTAEDLDVKRLPELRAKYGYEEVSHFIPGSRSAERKVNEGNRSVLYLHNNVTMSISVIDGFPSKIKIRQARTSTLSYLAVLSFFINLRSRYIGTWRHCVLKAW